MRFAFTLAEVYYLSAELAFVTVFATWGCVYRSNKGEMISLFR